MPLSTAERTTLLVRCPSCGKGTEKGLAWLMREKDLACVTSGCGNTIDLNSVENRILIDEASEYARRADARLSQFN